MERSLVRAWRDAAGLTLEALGKGFRPPRDRHRVGEIERRENSMTVDLILEVIHAFGRAGKPIGPAGAEDHVRLSIFFGGPEEADSRRALFKAVREVAAQEGGRRG
jgi:hypothetical protein